MSTQNDVIYCRYSSDMQRVESCSDQERDVRGGVARQKIELIDVIVIRDEAESGTRTDRDGFQRLCEMVKRREVRILAVDDQSRLSRTTNAFAFITDLVFSGGRFISTGEGIDTAVPGWELKVQVLQLHHGQTVRDLQHRVRRGQEGRVRADGSAGDFPFGYESYYFDPDWADQLARRGPKPMKGLRIFEQEAVWVRQVFAWFVAGRSIGWIARELTKLNVPKGHRASKSGWHPQQVRRMLANTKYVGKWGWGKTTTQRNSCGQKKQIGVSPAEQVCRDRANLRIIGQDDWDSAKARLAKLGDVFGSKPGQKARGQKPNPAELYPRSPLGGVLTCGRCGSKMWQHKRQEHRYYACSGAKSSRCTMTTQVPAERAERGLTDFVLGLLKAWPEWMHNLYQLTCDAIHVAADRIPDDRERDARRAVELDRQIENLVTALAEGGMSSSAVTNRLGIAEREMAEIELRLTEYAKTNTVALALPDETWVAEQVGAWATGFTKNPNCESLLRTAFTSVVAEPVIALGKTRGFIRLKFRVDAWNTLIAAIGDRLPPPVRGLVGVPDQGHSNGPEFTLDLGEPTAMDRWAPQIAVWRTEGVTWEEIARRTGMDLNRVFIAWKRYTGGVDTPPIV